nr:hypothetical protein [Pseudomonas poae]
MVFDQAQQVMIFPFAGQDGVFVRDEAKEPGSYFSVQQRACKLLRALYRAKQILEVVPGLVALDQAVAKILTDLCGRLDQPSGYLLLDEVQVGRERRA